jgi:quercetin dioxygenase-like cupin family protein
MQVNIKMSQKTVLGPSVLSVLGAVALSGAVQAGVSHQKSSVGLPSRQKRLTPIEIKSLKYISAGTGTSGISGIQTRVLKGDPSQPGMYTIELRVPAHTRIEAHEHPDDRIATVVSGTWFFGYGRQFEAKTLKALKPGSFYTEPSHEPHFARTGSTAAVVQITGFGPSGTKYENESRVP